MCLCRDVRSGTLRVNLQETTYLHSQCAESQTRPCPINSSTISLLSTCSPRAKINHLHQTLMPEFARPTYQDPATSTTALHENTRSFRPLPAMTPPSFPTQAHTQTALAEQEKMAKPRQTHPLQTDKARRRKTVESGYSLEMAAKTVNAQATFWVSCYADRVCC